MSRHRKGNAFPDLNTPGDPRTLAAIERRTPTMAGGSVTHVFGGTIMTAPKGGSRASTAKPPLYPSISTIAEVLKLKITPGMSAGVIPEFGGNPLDTDPAPAYTVTTATKLWLKIEWVPGSDSEDGVFWMTSGGELESAEFVVNASRPSETTPLVDEDGTITNGVFVFLWASIVASGATYIISARRSGSHDFTFCPSSLKLLFD